MLSRRYCFVEAMLENNTLDKGMYNILQEWYDYIMGNMDIQTDLISIYRHFFNFFNSNWPCSNSYSQFQHIHTVYLQTTPETVHRRIKKRDRAEEKALSLEYLKQLHDLHENWLVKGHHHLPAPVSKICFPKKFDCNFNKTPHFFGWITLGVAPKRRSGE